MKQQDTLREKADLWLFIVLVKVNRAFLWVYESIVSVFTAVGFIISLLMSSGFTVGAMTLAVLLAIAFCLIYAAAYLGRLLVYL